MEPLQRIERLQAALRARDWHGMILSQNVDIFYFTGTMQTGYLFVPAVGAPVFAVRRSLLRAQQESAVPVVAFGGFKQLATQFLVNGQLAVKGQLRLALEFDVLPVQQFLRLQSVFPDADWQDGSTVIRELRMIKSAYEIEQISQAAMLVDQAFTRAVSELHIGMTEIELLALIEQTIRQAGHLGPMRMRGFNQEIVSGLVAAGARAAVPTYFDGPAGGRGMSPAFPQSASMSAIVAGEPILIDIGSNVNGYVIDQTRTVVIGSLSQPLLDAYELAQRILQQLELMLHPGTECESIYEHALAGAEAAGLAEHFMGFGNDRVKFVGHGIGLEVDEWPVLAKGFKGTLEAGMVIALEPKFSFPELGVVGIEDSYLITNDGFVRLTRTEQRLFHVN